MIKPVMFLSALGIALIATGSPVTSLSSSVSTSTQADSVVLTISIWGDAQPRGALHRFTLQDGVTPSKKPTWRAASLLTRADTIFTTLPAQLLLGKEPSELTLASHAVTPNVRFELDIIEIGKDSLTRCTEQGRMFELGRLPEGTVVYRVDGSRPPACQKRPRS